MIKRYEKEEPLVGKDPQYNAYYGRMGGGVSDPRVDELVSKVAALEVDTQIMHDWLQRLEDRMDVWSENSRFGYVFKRGLTILLEWYLDEESSSPAIRFYGSTIDYLFSDIHYEGATIAGANIVWVDDMYVALDISNPQYPTLVFVQTLQNMLDGKNLRVFAHMHYFQGKESISVFGYGTIPSTLE